MTSGKLYTICYLFYLGGKLKFKWVLITTAYDNYLKY